MYHNPDLGMYCLPLYLLQDRSEEHIICEIIGGGGRTLGTEIVNHFLSNRTKALRTDEHWICWWPLGDEQDSEYRARAGYLRDQVDRHGVKIIPHLKWPLAEPEPEVVCLGETMSEPKEVEYMGEVAQAVIVIN
jgi:hypothetical protein